tara:strand:- start:469 stop:672 length:204 start_codon:yes stop_codon:yes gene_type:complete
LSLTTIRDTSPRATGTITILTGNATNKEMPQALGHLATTSMKEANSIDSMAKDITPDINNDMKNENV